MNVISSKARQFDLEPRFVAAIVWTESAGRIYASRFEPQYKYIHKPEKFARAQGITEETELMMQRMSFGLAQIMGATARYMGYDAALPGLFKPENNLFWACKYLGLLKQKYNGDLRRMASAYNAGSPRTKATGEFVNQRYVNEIHGRYLEVTAAGQG